MQHKNYCTLANKSMQTRHFGKTGHLSFSNVNHHTLFVKFFCNKKNTQHKRNNNNTWWLQFIGPGRSITHRLVGVCVWHLKKRESNRNTNTCIQNNNFFSSETRLVVLKMNEHNSEELLRLNPRGELPILTDNEAVLHEESAMLQYIEMFYTSQPKLLPDPEKDKKAYTDALVLSHEALGTFAFVFLFFSFYKFLDLQTHFGALVKLYRRRQGQHHNHIRLLGQGKCEKMENWFGTGIATLGKIIGHCIYFYINNANL